MAAIQAMPLEQTVSLATRLTARLQSEIEEGRLSVGDRLPSELDLVKAFGVSRTVVREAISVLRTRGLVKTSQGRGAFVLATVPKQQFAVTQEEIESLEDILQVLELRAPVEAEAAALAAERRTKGDLVKMNASLKAIDRAIEHGEDAIGPDIDFHYAIAAATGNQYYGRLLLSFKTALVARRRFRVELRDPQALQAYLRQMQEEHRAIAEAISAQDAPLARRAMQHHLARTRYHRLSKAIAEQAVERVSPLEDGSRP